jgi:hypothetical protein
MKLLRVQTSHLLAIQPRIYNDQKEKYVESEFLTLLQTLSLSLFRSLSCRLSTPLTFRFLSFFASKQLGMQYASIYRELLPGICLHEVPLALCCQA